MRIPLALTKSVASETEKRRDCGPCTACCVLPRISAEPEFPNGKPGYTPCQHLNLACGEGSCTIYADRPNLCREYSCLWRAGILEGDERRRPDNLGLMFVVDVSGAGGLAVEAWELWEGAASEHPGKYLIDTITQRFVVSIRFYGVPASILYQEPDKHALMELGRCLSRATRDNPRAVAVWCEANVNMGFLTVPEMASVMNDLESLRAGTPVARHYKRR